MGRMQPLSLALAPQDPRQGSLLEIAWCAVALALTVCASATKTGETNSDSSLDGAMPI